jgi:hypothetical protein
VSYYDSDTTDEGNVNYRSDNEGVDIVTGNSGYAIGYTAKSEWLEYTVNVAKAGKYKCVATASSGTTGSQFYVLSYPLSGSSSKVLWQFDVPQTASNSWGTYKKIEPTPINNASVIKDLKAGEQRIRIKITGANCNIDKIEILSDESTGIEDVENGVATPAGTSYNLSGQKVADKYRGIVVRNGRKTLRR